MTPDDLRAAMPTLDRVAYLNTGASSPTPRPVVEAVQDAAAAHGYDAPAEEGQYVAADETYAAAREAVAGLLGADPGEVALAQSTTGGINRIATALPCGAGDTVVRTDVEHSAGILPWRRLADTRGMDVRVVETDRGRLDPDDVGTAVRETGAELVVLSAVDWGYGRQLPVTEAVAAAHDAGARVLVDAVQAVGQQPVDVEEWGAEFVAAAGHKWLLGPWGAGFLYVRDGSEEWLRPERIGYRSVEPPDGGDSEDGDGGDDDDGGYTYRAGARRLEVATATPLPYAGLVRAIDLLDDVGIDAVTGRIERLTDRLKAGLPGGALVGPQEYHSGLVSFRADDSGELVEELKEAGVVVRTIPTLGTVRASVHAFNTAEDVDRLLDVVEGW